jgi:hypothetical protein
MEPWIIRMCREACRRQLIAWTVLFLGGLGFALYNVRYVTNFASGPYTLQADQLAQINNAEKAPHYFVSVTGTNVIDTGVQEITTETRNGVKENSYVSAGYYAVLIGDRYLIVKQSTKPSGKVEGQLVTIPADLANQLFTGPEAADARNTCYPFYLEAEGFRTAGYWGIAIGVVFLLLFVISGGRALRRLQDINKHPVVQRLQKWGDPLGISVEAERERSSGVRYRTLGIFLTDKFVIVKRLFSFNVFRFQDLLWAYKKVTQRRVNFIPAGKTYAAILTFYGGNTTFTENEQRVNEVLAFASKQAPWAIVGYSKEVDQLFRKKQKEFCAAVEARRQELLVKK